MARSISTIKNQIIATKNAEPVLGDLNSTSKTARWNLWAYIIAVCVNLFEQLQDFYTTYIESRIKVAGVGGYPWLREQVLKFQSGDVVNLNTTTFEAKYPVVDATKRILTRASVTKVGKNEALVRVAKGEPPQKITTLELQELIGYIESIEFAGSSITVKTFDADKITIVGTVYFLGEYASVIQVNVIAALNMYLSNISSATNFGGQISVNDIEDTIRGVDGVTQFKPVEIAVRPDLTPYANRAIVYRLATATNIVTYNTISGYVVQETESTHTFADTLSFIVDSTT